MRPGTAVRDRTRPRLGIGIIGVPVDEHPLASTSVWVYWPRGRRRAVERNLEPVREVLDPERLEVRP